MKKEQFLQGLEAVDDELITEAASTKSKGIKYKTKVRLTRLFMGTAAAAVMVTTGVLLHMNSKKAPESKSYAGAAVSEGQTKPAQQQTATERPTLNTYSISNGEGGSNAQPWDSMLLPEDVSFDGNEFFKRMDNYSYKADETVVNVQFNIASNFGTWINCGEEQADYILGELDKINDLKQEEAKGFYEFSSGVYNVNVEYKDGSSKIYTIPGGTIYQIQENDKCFQYELKEGSTEELYSYLNTTYLLLQDIVEEKLGKPKTTTTTTTSDVTTSIEYSTYAKTTTRTGTADTTSSVQTTTAAENDEPQVTTVTVPPEREFVYNGRTGEVYDRMMNYTWGEDMNIVNVQYGTAVTRDRGVWINCIPAQADIILDKINELQPEKAMRRDISGGGFVVRVTYADGKTAEYEFMGEDYYIVMGTDGLNSTYTDNSGVAKSLTLYLQQEFMREDENIRSLFEEKYGS